MSGRVKGKRILITGASSGIGKAAAALLVREGARVVIGSSNPGKGERAAAEIGAGYIRVDVREEAEISAFINSGAAALGGLDVLIQNSGVQYGGQVERFPTEQWDDIMRTNVRSMFLGAKYAIPHLKQAGGGSVINTSSVAGKRGGAGMSAYAASKGAIIAFGTALGRELAPLSIRVNTVCPGWVDTEFNGPAIANLGGLQGQAAAIKAGVPLGRQAKPEEIAPMYVYLASDESSFVTCQSYLVDGGQFN